MNIKNEIKIHILDAVKNLQNEGVFSHFEIPEFEVERPLEGAFGDYSANIALKLSKVLNLNPRDIAGKLKDEISRSDNGKIFSKADVAGPGFLNLYLSDDFVSGKISEAKKEGENFGSSDIGKGKKILIEFISANPTGDLHLGHGRGAFFGDALANVLSFSGFLVTKEFYVNDSKKSTQILELGKTALGKGESYKTEKLLEKIKMLEGELSEAKDEADAGSVLARELLRDMQGLVKNKLKIDFDSWFSEQKELYETGKVDEIYDFLKKKGLIFEKEGAEWLKLSEYGDSEDRVIVRSDEKKSPTYLLPDIAYHKNKIERGFDKLINIWGADHQGHVKSMQAVMNFFCEKNKLEVFITQMVALKDEGERFKLSKRTGKIVTMEWLVDEVGIDSARFFYLLKSIDTQMEFDLALAKEQSEKNPIFYVQYAHARIASILRKAEEEGYDLDGAGYELSGKEEERKLALEILKFPEVIENIAELANMQTLPHYTLELARKFHSFYASCRVLGNENKNIDISRIALIKSAKQTLKNALSLIGVSAPEKM
ncbi:arginine--tRNA ligase [Candidatus Azambacteria bacterium]|nr:arginine--tRNA ligase [Candidatus Azambacteria bacterium]